MRQESNPEEVKQKMDLTPLKTTESNSIKATLSNI